MRANTSSHPPTPPSSSTPDAAAILSLNQTYSPYWIALNTNQETLNLPSWKLILKTPYQYIKNSSQKGQSLAGDPLDGGSGPLGKRAEGGSVLNNSGSWNNSWQLKEGEHNLIIVYLPQYLEFFGFAL